MSLLLVLFLTLEGADPPIGFSPPPRLAVLLEAVSRPIEEVGRCIDTHASRTLAAEREELERRLATARDEAAQVWTELAAYPSQERPISDRPALSGCSPDHMRTELAHARQALDEFSRLFANSTNARQMPGLWLGPLRLCRESVDQANVVPASWSPDEDALTVKLVPGLKAALSQITGRAVDRPLAIRLDGSVVSQPNINEPIEGGEIQVSGPSRDVLVRMASSAKLPC